MSENRDQILEAIRVQGDLVRSLKATKEAPEKVRSRRRTKTDNVTHLFVVVNL